MHHLEVSEGELRALGFATLCLINEGVPACLTATLTDTDLEVMQAYVMRFAARACLLEGAMVGPGFTWETEQDKVDALARLHARLDQQFAQLKSEGRIEDGD